MLGNLHRARRIAIAVASATLLGLGLSACEPTLSVTADPSLFPAFSTSVPDYVTRCQDGDPVDVSVSAPEGTTVSVDDQPAQGGNFTAQVDLDSGQRFTIVVDAEATTTHSVRCLPPDFPQFEAERTGATSQQWYLTVPNIPFADTNYVVLFDARGVPVWWLPPRPTMFATVLPGNKITWAHNAGGFTEVELDASVVRTTNTVGAPSDFHDILRLPNGNYAMVTQSTKTGVDLTAIEGPANATVIDHVIQEVTPGGSVVWQWRTSNHIPVTESTETWWNVHPFDERFDPWHWNSIEWTGDGFIVSYRHLDAIYKIDKASKDIVWKIGGTARPESLTVVDDPVFDAGGSFSGQHDARLLSNGDVTLFDNGSSKGRRPRSVRYAIDEAGGTATLVDSLEDAIAADSFCCGSTRLFTGGNWLNGWGSTPHITENTADGSRVLRISLPGSIVYRAVPVPFGVFTRDAVRAGMDAQFPRSK